MKQLKNNNYERGGKTYDNIVKEGSYKTEKVFYNRNSNGNIEIVYGVNKPGINSNIGIN